VVRLVRALVGLDGGALQFSTLPVQTSADASYSLAQPTADQTLAGLRGGPSPAGPPAGGSVPAPGPSC
jgi:hypothetical protein